MSAAGGGCISSGAEYGAKLLSMDQEGMAHPTDALEKGPTAVFAHGYWFSVPLGLKGRN